MNYEEITGVKGHKTYTYNNKLLYSKYDPYKEAMTYLSSLASCKNKVLTFGGADFINHAAAQKTDITEILSFEPIEFPHLTNAPYLTRVNSIEKLSALIQQKNLTADNTTLILWMPFIETNQELFITYLTSIKNALVKATLSTINSNTFVIREEKNIKTNRHRFREISILINRPLTAPPPAVVISAGGSVVLNRALLQKIAGKCLLFAYPSALPYLDAVNITPDFTIAVDPGYATFYHLYKYRKEITLLCTLALTQSALSIPNYRKLFFSYGTHKEQQLYANRSILTSPPEGSVAFNLLRVLSATGFGHIFLFGQDFSYFEGRSHLKGGSFECELAQKTTYYETLETIIKKHDTARIPTQIRDNDKMLPSDTAMSIYYHHFMEKAHEFPIYLTGELYTTYSGRVPYLPETFFDQLPVIDKMASYFTTEQLILPEE